MSGPRFHPAVAPELADAVLWFEERSHRVAARFRDEFDDHVARIVATPGLGHPCGRFRRVNLKRYPYHVLYAVSATDEVWVLVLRHDARHPDYGMARTIPEES